MTHGLDTTIRTAHAVRQIRGTSLASESLGGHTEAGDLPTPPAPAARRRRDGAVRIGAISCLDPDRRASLIKPLAALGWDADTALVAEVDGPTAVVRVGKPTTDRPWLLPVRVKAGRITLPPPLAGSLGVDAGDQVLAVALPGAGETGTGELLLAAAADVLQSLTGDLTVGGALAEAEPAPPTRPTAPVTRVRPAFSAG